MDRLSDYDYELPPELLATEPPERREDARLMVVRRDERTISHHSIVDLPDLLDSDDCLVMNNTRVLQARLFGMRTETGGKWEGLFIDEPEPGVWHLIGETRGKLHPGETLTLHRAHSPDSNDRLIVELISRDEGTWTARPQSNEPATTLLDRFGTLPLPPYIGRKLASDIDRTRYQTTFAAEPGAIAAPTAGLHFTPELLSRCEASGIAREYVTLHVGIGTFRPVSTDNLDDHVMHSERCILTAEAAERLNQVRSTGGRVVAIGTTSVRTLESAAAGTGQLTEYSGDTDIFIRPPYTFQAVDALLTNFHLPKSTLLMLVSALADVELIQQAYATAIAERYRFYSYGDAMLIV